MWNRTENQIRIVLLRHGATKANKERRYLGKTEEVLTEEGRSGLLACRAAGCYPKADRLFSSPMRRCLQSAELLYPELPCVVIPEWEEIDFGAFEGRNYPELQHIPEYQAWIDSGGTLPFPGGESREDFIARCVAGFEKMLGHLTAGTGPVFGRNPEGRPEVPYTVVCLVHGGTIMALLSRYYGGDYFDYQVPNGGGYSGMLWQAGGRTGLSDVRQTPAVRKEKTALSLETEQDN